MALNLLRTQVERTKTDLMVAAVRFMGLLAIMAFLYALWIKPQVDDYVHEERFYSAACKLSPSELPTSVLTECAARMPRK